MSGSILYLLIGAINAAYLGWLFVCRDVMTDERDKRNLGFPNEVNLGEVVAAVFIFVLFTILWPLFVVVSIGITWHEFNFADIVLWRRRIQKTKQELNETAVKEAAEKLGYDLKKREPKPVLLKGADSVAN